MIAKRIPMYVLLTKDLLESKHTHRNVFDPAIPLLGIHTKETRIERDTCTPMFITARTVYNSQDMETT